jgi:hypothetical protein
LGLYDSFHRSPFLLQRQVPRPGRKADGASATDYKDEGKSNDEPDGKPLPPSLVAFKLVYPLLVVAAHRNTPSEVMLNV